MVLCSSESRAALERALATGGGSPSPALVDVSALAGHPPPPRLPGADRAADAPVVVQYTSGSTRDPRGVVISGENILTNAAMAGEFWHLDEKTVLLNWMPAYHDMGLIGGIFVPIVQGGRMVQAPTLTVVQRPARWLRAIAEHGVTVSGGPPFAFSMCLERVSPDDAAGIDLSRWEEGDGVRRSFKAGIVAEPAAWRQSAPLARPQVPSRLTGVPASDSRACRPRVNPLVLENRIVKTVILAGGRGTRLAEETVVKPKPMVEIGGIPMLVHIMRIYGSFGLNEFVLALGYKGEVIKEYFLHYRALTSDLMVDLATGAVEVTPGVSDDWRVHLINTGDDTMTGGRLKRLDGLLRPEGTFLVTYGDGVADVDVGELLAFHRRHGRLATVTAVRPGARFGAMGLDGEAVTAFKEKPQTGEGWVNGGFFVFEPEVLDYVSEDATVLEREPLEGLAKEGQLMAYRHEGFWQCMDTVRDRDFLNELWDNGTAPWSMG